MLIIFTLAFAFSCLISCQELFCFDSHASSLPFMDHFDLLELSQCFIRYGQSDDPTFVHFVFKCKILNNALILGEHSYICQNTLLMILLVHLLIIIKYFTLKDKPFLFGTLCHHEKCRGFGLFIGTSLSLGVGYLIPYFCGLASYNEISL